MLRRNWLIFITASTLVISLTGCVFSTGHGHHRHHRQRPVVIHHDVHIDDHRSHQTIRRGHRGEYRHHQKGRRFHRLHKRERKSRGR